MAIRGKRTESERRAIEAQAAGISVVRQAAARYLVNYGVGQDRAWQIAMSDGEIPTPHPDVEIPPVMTTIFAALDDAVYAVEALATMAPTLEDALAAMEVGGTDIEETE